MLNLWARRYDTRRYHFIKPITFENRYYEVDQLDPNEYYEAMVVTDKQEMVYYQEIKKPYTLVRRKK